jgi:hypothetical protein
MEKEETAGGKFDEKIKDFSLVELDFHPGVQEGQR